MNRSDALTNANAALVATNALSDVFTGARRRYPQSPTAILAGQSSYPDADLRTRESNELGHEIVVTLLILSDEGDEEAVETQMSALVETVVTALESNGFTFLRSDAANGIFLPIIDGLAYRTERLLFSADATE